LRGAGERRNGDANIIAHSYSYGHRNRNTTPTAVKLPSVFHRPRAKL
jgi:hypothetical protein